MYGPLNGVRVALVATAVLAVITAIAIGQLVGGLVIAAAVALHGYGWVYLKKKAIEAETSTAELRG